MHSFVSCRIDYCHSLLYGLPDYQLAKLQRVQNLATRLAYKESTTPTIEQTTLAPHTLQDQVQNSTFNIQGHKSLSSILQSGNELLSNFPLRKSYSTFGDDYFSVAAPYVWNSLPFLSGEPSLLTILKVNLKAFTLN